MLKAVFFRQFCIFYFFGHVFGFFLYFGYFSASLALPFGLKKAEVLVKGQGAGRETSLQALQVLGLEILYITDITPVPYNGCRPPKSRRV